MPGFNSNYGGATVYVDISHLKGTIDTMKYAMTEKAFHEMMRRTFNDAGKKVRTILKTEVPKDYQVGANWVGEKVGWPKINGLSCVVPIRGTRGSDGGRFPVKGARGRPRKGVKKTINVAILRGKTSQLPDSLPNQGGQPPFIMMNGSKKVVMTRKYANKSLPIVHVVGLGVPQMPINKSEAKVQEEITKVIEKRLVHHYERLFK